VQILITVLVNVVSVDMHGFNVVMGWFSPVFAGPDRSRSIARSTALGVIARLFRWLCSSMQWIAKWLNLGD